MTDRMNHEDISIETKIDIIHVKIDYIMQLLPVVVGTLITASQGKSAEQISKAFKPAKKLAEELNTEIDRIIEREAGVE